eukprot:1156943-Pelagomonas_calceolata.AAC.3
MAHMEMANLIRVPLLTTLLTIQLSGSPHARRGSALLHFGGARAQGGSPSMEPLPNLFGPAGAFQGTNS